MIRMKTLVQNVSLVAAVMGGATLAYGPSAEARNYGGAYPNWGDECLSSGYGGFDPSGASVTCTFEESTEQYKNGSYKEEIILEGLSDPGNREEVWEIANAGYGHNWPGGGDDRDRTHQMTLDFDVRLRRTVDYSVAR